MRRAVMSAWRPLLSSVPLLVLLAVAGLVSFGAPAAAHVGSSTGYAQARTEGTDLALTLRLDYSYVSTAVGLGPEARNDRDQAAQAAALAAGAPALDAYFADHVRVYVDGVGCDPELRGTGVDEHQGTRFGRVDLAFDCPESFDGSYHLEYDAFSSPGAAVDHDELVLSYQVADQTGRAVLDRSRPTWTVGETSGAAAAGRFVMMGGQHILFGLDHVLFVIALLLGSRRVRDLVTVASLFTLAHSVTLVMTALSWIEFPAWLVEPMIALSIAFVAVDNLLGRGGRLRLAAVFGFGLLHGMGFAGSLRFDDELSWGLIGSLLSFNVGIELGQAAVLSVAFPLVVLARRTRWSSHVLVAATSAVAGVGAFWFVERLGQVL